MLLDLSPLRRHRDFRLVFIGQLVSAFGTFLTCVAVSMVSGLFRMTIWNETIPSTLRGRMAGIEQLSYMSGPLLGNARAGLMAEHFGLGRSIISGGFVCVACVLGCIPALPAFWRYRKDDAETGGTKAAAESDEKAA